MYLSIHDKGQKTFCPLSFARFPADYLPLAIFSEDRGRLGSGNDEIFAFSLPLLSPFAIFVHSIFTP